jgi:geranylgeranyl diphosphate synthase type I
MSSNDLQPRTSSRSEQTGESSTFQTLLEEFRSQLEGRLKSRLLEREEADRREVGDGIELSGALRRFLMRGGKRLRPALLYYACRGAGGEVDGEGPVWPAAMAVELLHTYLLIHDDIMDQAVSRRGGPSVHQEFEALHRSRGWPGSAVQFGCSTAILLGDLAYTEAMELVGEFRDGSATALFRRCFSQMSREVIVGQYLEITAPARTNLGEEDLLRILRMKSGRYSAEHPIRLGCLLAEADEGTVRGLCRYGLEIGEAFQLQDDLLGVFGEPERVGKPVGADLAEGKLTLLVHHALEAATSKQREKLRSALGDPSLGVEGVEEVRQILRQSGARDRVLSMVERRLERARQALEGLALDKPGRVFFVGLIEALRGREK